MDDITRVPVDQRGHRALRRRDGTTDLTPWKEFHDRLPDIGYSVTAWVERTDCSWCGEYPWVTFDGELVTLTPDCTMPAGVTIEFDLAVPSGEIVVRDDLRPVFDIPDELENRLRTLNSAAGQMDLSLELAKIGCARGGVGNSSPGLYRVDEDHYVIGDGGYDEDGNEEIPLAGEWLTTITTDTWSYNIADAADWDAKLAVALTDETIDEGRWWRGTEPTRLKVKPGIYHFTHHVQERGFDLHNYTEPQVYAHIERRDA